MKTVLCGSLKKYSGWYFRDSVAESLLSRMLSSKAGRVWLTLVELLIIVAFAGLVFKSSSKVIEYKLPLIFRTFT